MSTILLGVIMQKLPAPQESEFLGCNCYVKHILMSTWTQLIRHCMLTHSIVLEWLDSPYLRLEMAL
jgi:hypothetical protein